MKPGFLKNKTAQSCLWLAALLALWEIAARAGLVNRNLLPPFSDVAVRLAREIFGGKLGEQTLNSLWVIACGFAISFVLAIVITALCAWSSPAESLFNTLSTVMNPLPAVALMPLIIMWFGINIGAMLAIIVHGVLWALVRHLLDGIRAIPQTYREWGRNIELSPHKMFAHIIVFSVLPELLAGIRVGWGRAWRALISAEMIFGMIGEKGGLGFYISQNRAYANITNVMGGIVIIVIVGIAVESLLFSQIEKHTVRKWGMADER
jgi:NitT/TauT family transport system permease protein